MVVVNKHDGQRLSLGMDADTLRYVLERAVALIMKEQDPIIGCNGQVGVTIIIVIGSGAGDGVQLGIEAGFLCDIFKIASPRIVKKRDSLAPSIGKEQIRMAIIIKIKEACAGANLIYFRCAGGLRGQA